PRHLHSFPTRRSSDLQAHDQGHASWYSFLALAGESGDLLFSDPRACNFPAREVSGRAALWHVCAGPEGQPGDILFLHDSQQWSEDRKSTRLNSSHEWI